MNATSTRDCLDDDELVRVAAGGFDALGAGERASKEHHVAVCSDCRMLLAMACQELAVGNPEQQHPLLMPGTKLAERYLIEGFLARGGMGEVYAARDLELEGPRIALKTLAPCVLHDAQAVRRLKSEVQLAQRVSHPHICRVHHFGIHQSGGGEPIHFLTMELIEGETLSECIERQGALTLPRVRSVAEQLLSALAAAHRVDVLHRDLKSSNVMLRRKPLAGSAVHAMLMDFGLARSCDESTERLTARGGAFIGSAAYMSPEQVLAEALTPASDIYSLGVVLFEMLTGRLPFVARSASATAYLRLEQPAPRASLFRPELGVGWDRIVAGCLERRVERRYRSAEAVSSALQGLGDAPRGLPRGSLHVAAGLAVVASIAALRPLGSRGSVASAPSEAARSAGTAAPAAAQPTRELHSAAAPQPLDCTPLAAGTDSQAAPTQSTVPRHAPTPGRARTHDATKKPAAPTLGTGAEAGVRARAGGRPPAVSTRAQPSDAFLKLGER